MTTPFERLVLAVLLSAPALLASEARAQEPGPPADRPQPQVVIELERPGAGPIGDTGGLGFVSGRAFALAGPAYEGLDVVIALDTSSSTEQTSGGDLNGDGRIDGARRSYFWALRDRLPDQPPILWDSLIGPVLLFVDGPISLLDSATGRRAGLRDTVLHAEAAAVEVLLDRLDPRLARVALVTFAGGRDDVPAARLEVPLTDDYDRIRAKLAEIVRRGSAGKTHLAEAIRVATKTLAVSERRASARPIAVILSDGVPTLPSEDLVLNQHEVLRAARSALRYGVRMDTFGVSEQARGQPKLLDEIAQISRGTHRVLATPADLPNVFGQVQFSDLEQIRVANRTLDAEATYLTANHDGSFGALVPMRLGANEIVVSARTPDGAETSERMIVSFDPAAPSGELELRSLRDRSKLLEARLRDLAQARGVAAPVR